MPDPRSPSAATEHAELYVAQMQRHADAAAKYASELSALYPRTRWQRVGDRFRYHVETIAMHLRGDFRGR